MQPLKPAMCKKLDSESGVPAQRARPSTLWPPGPTLALPICFLDKRTNTACTLSGFGLAPKGRRPGSSVARGVSTPQRVPTAPGLHLPWDDLVHMCFPPPPLHRPTSPAEGFLWKVSRYIIGFDFGQFAGAKHVPACVPLAACVRLCPHGVESEACCFLPVRPVTSGSSVWGPYSLLMPLACFSVRILVIVPTSFKRFFIHQEY